MLARWSQRRYPTIVRELHDETGIDPEWIRSGMLILEAGDRAPARQWAEAFAASLERLDAPAAGRCEPALADPRAALWLPDVAQVRNPCLT